MYKDIEDIIHKYHLQLKVNDLNKEFKKKYNLFFKKCFFCSEIDFTVNDRTCYYCDRYFCKECITNIISFDNGLNKCDDCQIRTANTIAVMFLIILFFVSTGIIGGYAGEFSP